MRIVIGVGAQDGVEASYNWKTEDDRLVMNRRSLRKLRGESEERATVGASGRQSGR